MILQTSHRLLPAFPKAFIQPLCMNCQMSREVNHFLLAEACNAYFWTLSNTNPICFLRCDQSSLDLPWVFCYHSSILILNLDIGFPLLSESCDELQREVNSDELLWCCNFTLAKCNKTMQKEINNENNIHIFN